MSATTLATLALQEPSVAWAMAEGRGELEGLGWVDEAGAPGGVGGARILTPAGPRYRLASVTRWLPPAVGARVRAAAALGAATAWDGLGLLIARPSWWIGGREHLFSPYGASSPCQADLLARWGLERRLHADDPVRIARIMALLPRWRGARGTVEAARQVCRAAEIPSPDLHERPGEDSELATCRSSAAWAASPPRVGGLRILGGVLRCAPSRQVPRPEALHLGWSGSLGCLAEVVRLLPVWTALHLHPQEPPIPARSEP